MTSKFSRAALIAGLAIGAGGLVAVPAEAANGVSTANYYVNNPAIGGASQHHPGIGRGHGCDRHRRQPGDAAAGPEHGAPVEPRSPAITITAEKWNDGTAPSYDDREPALRAGRRHSRQRLELERQRDDHRQRHLEQRRQRPGIGAQSGVPQPISNARRGQLLGRHVRVRPRLGLRRRRQPARPGHAAGPGHPGADDGRSLRGQRRRSARSVWRRRTTPATRR